ncbi:PKD domain-containing protein, partial [Thermodesulfobacteriota bacterium]
MGFQTKQSGRITIVVFLIVLGFLTIPVLPDFALAAHGFGRMTHTLKKHLPPGLEKRVSLENPILIAPQGDTTDKRPLYQWQPVSGANLYGLMVLQVARPWAPVYIKFNIRDTNHRPRWWKRLKYDIDHFFVIIAYNKKTKMMSPLSDKMYFKVVREIPNQAPVAVFTAAPESGPAPLTVHFDASRSHDPDGTVASYLWDFDEDGIFDGTGLNTEYTFTEPGRYTANLRITDNQDAFTETSRPIAVTYPLPSVTFEAVPSSILLGDATTLTWHTTHADSAFIEPDIGHMEPNGAITLSPLVSTIYTITVTGMGGTATANATVTVSFPLPTVILSADPQTIQTGEFSTLSWSSADAETCVIEPGIGSVDTSGSASVSPADTTTYTITGTGPGGTATNSITVTVIQPTPLVSLSVSPDTIHLGESAVLTWNSTHAETCEIQPDIGSVDTIGSASVSPADITTYIITATGPGGTATNSVTVTVIHPTPLVSSSVSPDTIHFGDSSTLTWNSTHADTCEIQPDIGSVDASGSASVSPPDTTTYIITATGPGGSTTDSVTITVIYPVPLVSLNAVPGTIHLGESATLTWNSTHADTCEIQPGIGSVDTSGSVTISPTDTTAYTITAMGTGSTTTDSVTVTVIPPAPLVSLTIDPDTIYLGRSATLSWHADQADTCVIEPDIGSVDVNGSVKVWPTETTTYTITATGPGGTSTSSAAVTITTALPDPPVVTITDPTNMVVVDADTVVVSGTVTPANAEVWVNGIPADTAGGNFMASNIPLEPGSNPIIATASHSGVIGKDKIWIVRAYDYQPQPEGSFGEPYEDLVPPDAVIESYEMKRFALVTGQVQSSDGAPVADVAVSFHTHPQYGTAFTDHEGHFSIPVEGGKTLTIFFRKTGLLSVHRQVYVPSNDTAVCETVQMTAEDSLATTVDFDGNAENVVTHQSTAISDEFGTRSCALVFSGDNRAQAVDDKGQIIEELDHITTRATTYTTPEAMPAELPPNSAYTYCVELSVDGAERVEFDKPVVTWVDNYLGFDVGEIVPAGYYDRDRGVWVAAENGVVVRLLDRDDDGTVDALDADGDDQPDDLDN